MERREIRWRKLARISFDGPLNKAGLGSKGARREKIRVKGNLLWSWFDCRRMTKNLEDE
jgi:hypothetical protein